MALPAGFMWMIYPGIDDYPTPVAVSAFVLAWQPIGWISSAPPVGEPPIAVISNIPDNSITTPKIVDQAVTAAKVSTAIATTTTVTQETGRAMAAEALLVPLAQKGAAGGVASLDAGGKVPSTQIPEIAIGRTYVVANQAAMLALGGATPPADIGDIAKRTDGGGSAYILQSSPPSTLANWVLLSVTGSGGGSIITVDGIGDANVVLPVDQAAGVGSHRTLGTSATSAAPGDLGLTTAGDLPIRDTTGRTRLPAAATTGHVLTADLTDAKRMKWAAPTGGGASDALSVTFADVSGGSIASTNVRDAIREVRDEAGQSSVTVSKPGIPATGCLFGAAVNPKTGQSGTSEALTQALESQMGAVFAGHRLYCSPGDLMDPHARDAELAGDALKDRTSYLSLRCPTGTTTWTAWAANTSLLTAAAQALGDIVAANGGASIVVMVDHEPDLGNGTIGDGNNRGTAGSTLAQSRAQYAHLLDVFFPLVRQYAPSVSTAVCFVGYKLVNNSRGAGTPGTTSWTPAEQRQMLPADLNLVDLICTDPYNTKTTAGMGADTYANLVTPWLSFCATYGNKPYASLEMGCSLEVGSAARAQWWTDALTFIKANSRIKGALAFHANTGVAALGLDAVHNWWIDDDTAVKTAIKNGTTVGPNLSYFHPPTSGTTGAVTSVDGLVGGVTLPADLAANVGSKRTLGAGALQAAPGNLGLTTPGDMAVFSSGLGGVVNRFPVSTTAGRVLTSDPTNASGMSWQAPGTGSGASTVPSRNIAAAPSYTAVIGDAGYVLQCQNTAPMYFLLPANADVPFPIDTQLEIAQFNTGTVVVAGATGAVSFISLNNYMSTGGRGAVIVARKNATNQWHLVGAYP